MLDVDVVGPISFLTSIVGAMKGCQLIGRLFGRNVQTKGNAETEETQHKEARLLVLSILDVCAIYLSDRRYFTHP